jgi:hypothetical protein
MTTPTDNRGRKIPEPRKAKDALDKLNKGLESTSRTDLVPGTSMVNLAAL